MKPHVTDEVKGKMYLSHWAQPSQNSNPPLKVISLITMTITKYYN